VNRQRSSKRHFAAILTLALLSGGELTAQVRTADFQPSRDRGSLRHVSGMADRGSSGHVREVVSARKTLSVRQHHSQLIIAKNRIARIAMTSPDVANFVQYSESELAIIGLQPGSTDLTLWFDGDPTAVIYDVSVSAPLRPNSTGKLLNEVAARLRTVFPRSRVQLIPVADQIVVKGQAWDTDEAAAIMQLLESQFGGESRTVLNMLRVPGEFQVLLKARIAELNRKQMRRLGVDCRELLSRSRQTSEFGPASAGISGVFTKQQTDRLMKWMVSNGTISYLAEPSLTVLSGHTGSFLSGGEFAVKTTNANGGVDTEFRKYGTSLKVTPTVVDRDLIRLRLTPEFSQLNDRMVDGIPGKNVRRIDTVVELREGQTIAIGGLVARQMLAEQARKPGFRDLFTRRKATEAETELLVVVTAELVRPMDAHEVPPLPNHYVTHPNNCELESGLTEGQPVTATPPSEFQIQAISAPVYRYEPAAQPGRSAARPKSASNDSRPVARSPAFPPKAPAAKTMSMPLHSVSETSGSPARRTVNSERRPRRQATSPAAFRDSDALPLVRPQAVDRNEQIGSSSPGQEVQIRPVENPPAVSAGPSVPAVASEATLFILDGDSAGGEREAPTITRKTPAVVPEARRKSAPAVPKATRQTPRAEQPVRITPPRPAAQLPRIGGHTVGGHTVGGHTLPIRTSPRPTRRVEQFPLPVENESPKPTQRSLPGIGHSTP